MKIAKAHVAAGIQISQHLSVGFFSPSWQLLYCPVPSLVAGIEHSAYLVHCFLIGEVLCLEYRDEIVPSVVQLLIKRLEECLSDWRRLWTETYDFLLVR